VGQPQLKDNPMKWEKLSSDLMKEIWLDKHLKKVLSSLRKKGILDGKEYTGIFSKANNPILYLK
jgi:hypothetical protein